MANKEIAHDDNLMRPVDFWSDKLSISPAAHAGVTMQEGWVDGKFISQKEYTAALVKFLGLSADDRKAVKNA